MILPTIDGRECVPVRLLPFMTNWRPLSPDVVARLFSRRNAWNHWSISSFNLSPSGSHNGLPPGSWNTVDDDLTVLALDLARQQDFEFEKYRQWRRLSVALLPAAVFVWRDELVAEYARSFGRQKYPSIRPDAAETSEEEAAAECELIIRLCSNPDTSEQADAAIERIMESVDRNTVCLPGDGELSFTPLLSAEERQVVFEGFNTVWTAGEPSSQSVETDAAPFAPADCGVVVEVGMSAGNFRRTTKTRGRNELDEVIELAQRECTGAAGTNEVWTRLVVLANDEHPPLLAAVPGGLKYTRNGRDAIFKKGSLSKRLKRRQDAVGSR